MPKHAFIHSSEIAQYRYPPENPFKTERAQMTEALLTQHRLCEGPSCIKAAPRQARTEELLQFHTVNYLEALKRTSQGEFQQTDLHLGLGSAECPVFPDLYNYATLAVGASLVGAELILSGEASMAFNPSGGYHHAFPAKADGFCYLNDVVLACKALVGQGRRVFCLDLDAHHGDGTQFAFYDDPRVFTLSMHESGKTLFPWGGFEDEIGEAAGRGYNVNLPLPAGTDDRIFEGAFRAMVPPLLQAYSPDVVVLELGMDFLSVDPLTHLNMTNNILADLLPLVRDSGHPILAVGGGGYHPESAARGWALAWRVLCDEEPDHDLLLGMGGDFLGNPEWSEGLRDPRVFTNPDERGAIEQEVAQTIERIRTTVFPLHGL